jgi:hypothetical protein
LSWQARRVVHQCYAEDFGEYYRKVGLRGLCSLQAISDEAFRQGLADLKECCQEQDSGQAVLEEIALLVFRSQ